jgi:hypothetical protein
METTCPKAHPSATVRHNWVIEQRRVFVHLYRPGNEVNRGTMMTKSYYPQASAVKKVRALENLVALSERILKHILNLMYQNLMLLFPSDSMLLYPVSMSWIALADCTREHYGRTR